MLSSNRPASFPIPFGKNAGGPYIRSIPVTSQIGIQDGAASLNDGFVPDNFTQIAAGGVPPFGQDMNGILFQATSWDQWVEAGGPVIWDSAFATAIGGYPKGAKLDSAILAGAKWYSTVESNTTNPDDPLTSAGWARVGLPAGTPLGLFTSTMSSGFVTMNALTIGNASSNAGYASADALFLFVANWLQFSNTQCPILTSAGVPTTRGANAVADFNANRQLTLPNGKGLSLIGADTMGGTASTFLSGVPITIGNATSPGSIIGEALHTLISGEIPPVTFTATTGFQNADHTHNYLQTTNTSPVGGGYSGTGNIAGVQSGTATSGESGSHAHAVSGSINGGGGAHNNTQRNMTVFWGQAL